MSANNAVEALFAGLMLCLRVASTALADHAEKGHTLLIHVQLERRARREQIGVHEQRLAQAERR